MMLEESGVGRKKCGLRELVFLKVLLYGTRSE